MAIDLKVLLRSFNCESHACYVWKPSRKFFRVRESNIVFSWQFRKSSISWLPNIGSAKDKHGVRESFAKVTFLFAKNGRSRIKEFWSTTIYIHAYTYAHLVSTKDPIDKTQTGTIAEESDVWSQRGATISKLWDQQNWVILGESHFGYQNWCISQFKHIGLGQFKSEFSCGCIFLDTWLHRWM